MAFPPPPPAGKGPLKEHYLSLIAKKQFEHVTITTLWLSTEDYPLLLGNGRSATVRCFMP